MRWDTKVHNGVVSVLLVAHLTVVSMYAGFQWTVQQVVYRQFSGVPLEAFSAYERMHQRRIGFVVGPLFAALVLTATGLLVRRPADVPLWGALMTALLVATVLAVTAFFAVPLHRRLSDGWDQATYDALLRADAVRVGASTLNVALVAHFAVS